MVENLLLGMSMQFISIKSVFRVKKRVRSTHLHLALGLNELSGGRKHRRVIGSNVPPPPPLPQPLEVLRRQVAFTLMPGFFHVLHSHRGRSSQSEL